MSDNQHAILCVDDEEKILHSLKRLLRRENYLLLIANSGYEALDILKENDVHLVISDYRMPGMNGTDFLALVKKKYPEIIRIVLTGYTEVESITDSINKGHIYKFILKPWNDHNLRLEIRHALEQYDLLKSNEMLHEKVLQQNTELKEMNERLEGMVRERTEDLEIQNQALELSRSILESLPIPVIGISSELMIAFTNSKTQTLSSDNDNIRIGYNLNDYFSHCVEENILTVLSKNIHESLKGYELFGKMYDIDFVPLSGKFCGKGVIMTLKANSNRKD